MKFADVNGEVKMTKKKIVRYMIYHSDDNYEREGTWQGYKLWRNNEIAFTKKKAIKFAKLIGKGAIIQQISKTKSGIIKVKEWIYG